MVSPDPKRWPFRFGELLEAAIIIESLAISKGSIPRSEQKSQQMLDSLLPWRSSAQDSDTLW